MVRNAGRLADQSGRRVVVTGGNSGLGFAVASALAAAGAHVTIACRDPAKGAAAARRMPGAVAVAALDLASLESIHAMGEAWRGPLDLLVNNAGVMVPPRLERTADGFELQFGVNHLGHFALTGRLLPALLAGDRPRVVTVSSLAHRSGTRDVVTGGLAGYTAYGAYANSKLANLLFASELQRRAGHRLVSTAAHPGLTRTRLLRNQGRHLLDAGLWVVGQSASAGAASVLQAATDAPPGSYVGPRGPGGWRGRPHLVRPAPLARDPALAAELWELSGALTGVEFDFS